jgi:predicted DNA-binding protein
MSIQLTKRENFLLRNAIESYVGELEDDIRIFYQGPNDGNDRHRTEQQIIDLWNLFDKIFEARE